jgi:hypothetical protein
MPHADDTAVERAVRSFAAAMLGLAAHELNNRLAVMRETVGLMEDLARAGKAGAAGTARAHSSLDDHVGRALNIVRTLSGLGGALGAGGGGFDAGAALGDLVDLTERWARQQSLRIERELAADLPRAAATPPFPVPPAPPALECRTFNPAEHHVACRARRRRVR